MTDFGASLGGFAAIDFIVSETETMLKESNLNKLDDFQNLYSFDFFSSALFYFFLFIGIFTILTYLWGVSQDRIDA